MFDWFKSKEGKTSETKEIGREPLYDKKVEPTVIEQILEQAAPEKSVQEIIQEIHDAYDGSAKAILEESQKVIAESDTADINKGERLAKLGFTGTKKAVSTERAIQLKKRAEDNAKLVQYYTQTYPFNKFITKEQVAEINKKYGLVCVPVAWYNADVPEKNLREIENFQVKEEDRSFQFTYSNWKGGFQRNHLTQQEFLENEKVFKEGFSGGPEGLYISCPESEADIPSNMGYYYDKQGFVQRKIEDPIVLQPVIGGFLIVSKWGLEAQDPDLINIKLN